MITVYHLERSRSRRIVWLLEELGLPYELERFPRDPATQRAGEDYRAVHPLGKSPVIRDGDVVLAESGAIVDYLVRRYASGRLAPAPDDPELPRYLHWLHFAEGSLMPFLILDLLLEMGGGSPQSEAIRAELGRTLDYVEAELGGREHFAAGGFSAADVMMAFAVEFAAARGQLEGRPALQAYLERMRARPAFARSAEVAS